MKIHKQPTFFDKEMLLDRLSELGDPLEILAQTVDFEVFRPTLSIIREQPRKSNAGAKPFDVLFMFKMLVVQKLNNLSDASLEFYCTDRASYRRFLGLESYDKIPDQNTVWDFREQLKKFDLVEKLFADFNAALKQHGIVTRSGQLVDASFIQAPRQRNVREENSAIKAGKQPNAWADKTAGFLRQKDVDARWAKKNDETFYGYKDHVNVDKDTKLITDFEVTSAEVHDSQVLLDVVDSPETGWSNRPLYADSAYRSDPTEQALRQRGVPSMIHEKGVRNKPLSENQKAANKEKSKIRCRVEHVFASMKQQGNDTIRTIGIQRAKVQIGLSNLVYNLKRSVWLMKSGMMVALNPHGITASKFA